MDIPYACLVYRNDRLHSLGDLARIVNLHHPGWLRSPFRKHDLRGVRANIRPRVSRAEDRTPNFGRKNRRFQHPRWSVCEAQTSALIVGYRFTSPPLPIPGLTSILDAETRWLACALSKQCVEDFLPYLTFMSVKRSPCALIARPASPGVAVALARPNVWGNLYKSITFGTVLNATKLF